MTKIYCDKCGKELKEKEMFSFKGDKNTSYYFEICQDCHRELVNFIQEAKP